MGYRDTWVTCTECGRQFIFRVEEQRRQAKRGESITSPRQCPTCRGVGRAALDAEPRREPKPTPRAEHESRAQAVLGPGPHEGHVKWYDGGKGYGFIVQRSGDEIFFHRTGIASGETPVFPDGTRVTYLIEHTVKGPQAVDVARMDAEDNV
jgi:CspA family cold shock protein